MPISTTPEKLQQTTDEIGPNPDVQSLPFIYVENPKIKLKNLIVTKKSIGSSNSFILGHPINGILGTANGIGGSQILLGSTSGDVNIELIRRAYLWNSKKDFEKGTITNLDVSQGFLQLGNVSVKNIALEHKTK